MDKRKATEPIGLWFKQLKSGNKTIYLRIPVQGLGARYKYENLGLYLVPEDTASAKKQNKKTLRKAESLRMQRTMDYLNGKVELKNIDGGNMLLVDWLDDFANRKKTLGQSKSNAVTINNVKLHLVKFRGSSVRMKQVSKEFCEDFILYLSSGKTIGVDNPKTGQHHEKPIARSTARLYFNTFVTALNEAVREGVIRDNPANRLKREEKRPIRATGSNRGYLDINELKKLISTQCGNEKVKQAFMFACFCGLRLSDIKDLRWRDIKHDKGNYTISKIQVKTRREIVIPLSSNALKWMPERNNAKLSDVVFDLPSHFTINRIVKRWTSDAEIGKNVTFHISRHTFATTLITLGADIYTTSKLLGHQNIRTTQIYAEIVDRKKQEAISLMDDIFKGD